MLLLLLLLLEPAPTLLLVVLLVLVVVATSGLTAVAVVVLLLVILVIAPLLETESWDVRRLVVADELTGEALVGVVTGVLVIFPTPPVGEGVDAGGSAPSSPLMTMTPRQAVMRRSLFSAKSPSAETEWSSPE